MFINEFFKGPKKITKQVTEGAQPLNLNDDDWYEINPSTNTIISQSGPSSYQSVLGQREIKLPNGNVVLKGMRAKWMDLNRGVEEGYAGIDDTDTVGFSVNSEAAYTAVMDHFGDHIDHDETSGIMYVPASMWPNVEAVAFDADGVGAEQDDGYEHPDSPEQEVDEGLDQKKPTTTHTSDCGYRYGHDCDCKGKLAHAGNCGYKYGHDCDCGLTKSKDVSETAAPITQGAKVTWFHSTQFPKVEGTVIGKKDGKYIVQAIDPSPRNTEKTVTKYLVGKNNIVSQGVTEGSKEKTQGIALSKAYKKDFDDKKPGQDRAETALTGTYSKTGKPGGNLDKKGVAEGYDEWRAQELEKLRTRHPEGTGSTPSKTLAKLMRIPGFSKVSPAEQHRVAKAVDGYLARDMSFDQALVLAQKKSVTEAAAQKYEMLMRNGQVKKFIAKDDADAKRIAAGHGAKSVIKLKANGASSKLAEQGVAEGFTDVVKGVKRSIKGKEKPEDVVQRRYIDTVDANHAGKDVSKTTKRYNKVYNVVNDERADLQSRIKSAEEMSRYDIPSYYRDHHRKNAEKLKKELAALGQDKLKEQDVAAGHDAHRMALEKLQKALKNPSTPAEKKAEIAKQIEYQRSKLKQGVAEGWKDKVAGGALALGALGGIGALQNVAPNTTYQGQQFQLAMPGKIPPDAKLVTDDNGKKIYVWKTAGQKNRISWSYRPVEQVKEQGVAEGWIDMGAMSEGMFGNTRQVGAEPNRPLSAAGMGYAGLPTIDRLRKDAADALRMADMSKHFNSSGRYDNDIKKFLQDARDYSAQADELEKKGVAEGWKEKVAGAALAGSMAMGGAPANAGFAGDLAQAAARGLGAGVVAGAAGPSIFKKQNAADLAFAEQIPDAEAKAKFLKAARYMRDSRDMSIGSAAMMGANAYDEARFKKLKQKLATQYNIQPAVQEGEIERQHGDLQPWAYWSFPERVAKKLYQIHKGQPIDKSAIVQLWKTDGPDRMTKFMLKPDVSAILYAYQQMSEQGPLFKEGVVEGVAETLPLNDAVKLLRKYGADHFKTTSNELHFYKNGKPLSVVLVMNPDSTRSVTLSSLNSATRGLKGVVVGEAVADSMTMDEAKKVLRHYGADHFKTTSNELHFYKNGKPLSVGLTLGADGVRSVTLSSLNSATRSLKGQGIAEGLHDSEDMAHEVYTEFARIYPNMARRANQHTVRNAIMDVLSYGGGERNFSISALAKDVARAVRRDIEHEDSAQQQQVNELSPSTLASYKKAAGSDASAADKRGDVNRGNKRFSGIVKATKKEFNQDLKK